MKIGVLALQGDFERHQASLDNLHIESLQIRTVVDINQCHGLIIPGGESTTLIRLLKESGLFQHIPKFGAKHPILGTCAGLILLAKDIINDPVESLGLVDVTVARNAYGRQIDSFVDTINIELNGTAQKFEGVFIRAPKIVKVGKRVNILGRHKDEIVFVESGHHLASTFHPELSGNELIHKYFIEKVRKAS